MILFRKCEISLIYCSFSFTGNIFVGQTESPLLIRPYILDLTTSELHAVMTAGFGTIAGSVLGAYLGFGVGLYNLKLLFLVTLKKIFMQSREIIYVLPNFVFELAISLC